MADFDLKNFSFSLEDGTFNFGEEPTTMDEVGNDPGIFLPNTEGRTEFLPPDPDRVPQMPAVDQATPEYAARPAEERIRELFNNMNPHRRVLYGALRELREPVGNDQVGSVIDALRAHKFSVYSTSNICTMLETAGAVRRVLEDGTPYEDFKPEPKIVVEDGVEYWQAVPAPMPYWQITEAGQAQLDSYHPIEKLEATFAEEAEYLTLYKRVLTLCTADEGVSMKQMSAAVDSDPLVATEPRNYFVQHFVEALERGEAVAWNGKAWKITEVGRQALAENLADVLDSYVVPTGAQPAQTESDGVNW
ncbi:hypothetical protein [uncultured Senegalimassilia sp.]|uniref:hypothetical protein n=1 Tax=uncultured Senegalimassilia sp. TaxID=1714350 RepID=UPI0026E01FD2|nr:hypothetical protein [uncultured Senegalimassilia sp.]